MPKGIGYSSGHGKGGGKMTGKSRGKKLDSPFSAAGSVAKAPGSKGPKKRGSDKRRA